MRFRLITAFAVLACAAGLYQVSADSTAAGPPGQWYRVDMHNHSTVSGDATSDPGILARRFRIVGYDAAFLTDHQAGSNGLIAGKTADHVSFADSLTSPSGATLWERSDFGAPAAPVFEVSNAFANTGTKSLHLSSTSTSFAEVAATRVRGPVLRDGDIILNFAAYPTRLDPGTGAYVSVSVGGDATTGSPPGFTDQLGQVDAGRHQVLVWQLGDGRRTSLDPADPSAEMTVTSLPYTPNQWNTYTINISEKLREVADTPSKRAIDLNALTAIKMAAESSGGGTADVYFDSYNLDALHPTPTGDAFVYRNSVLAGMDLGAFRYFPAIEMGIDEHANRFNFDISSGAEYNSFFGCNASGTGCTVNAGINAIPATQASGYPAQLNHPGLSGGVTAEEAVDSNGEGADAMEVVQKASNTVMIETWDRILSKGYQLLGSYGNDAHAPIGTGVATYLYASALELDPLMRAYFEGRSYLANANFTGRLLFGPDPATEPYPARYPVYLSPDQTNLPVNLRISGGIPSNTSLRWIVNGQVAETESPPSGSYARVRQTPLTGAVTYTRAELLSSSAARMAMTQPLQFRDVAGLPAGISYEVAGVTTPNGRGYTRNTVRGITSTSWNSGDSSIDLALQDPVGSQVAIEAVASGYAVEGITVDATPVSPAASLEDFNSAAGSSWFYEPSTQRLHLKVLHASADAAVHIDLTGAADLEAPTTPTGVHAVGQSARRIAVSWSASTDNVAVDHYIVRRDGVPVATIPGGTTTYTDGGLDPDTPHTYTVQAIDAANNASGESVPATGHTLVLASTTFITVADSYVDASKPSTNFGATNRIRVDSDPVMRSYVRFDVSGLQGTVESATLRLYATSSLTSPLSANAVADNSWGEATITPANAPTFGAQVGLSTATIATNSWVPIDVTPLVTGNGTVTIGLQSNDSRTLALMSKEGGAEKPQLVVETSLDSPPTQPTGLTATGVSTSRIDLAWGASTDNTGIDSYVIRRDGAPLTTVPGSETSYADTGLSGNASHIYTVQAVDTNGQTSPESDPATGSTEVATEATYGPVADSYVDASKPGINYGTQPKLRTDGDPIVRSYIRFNPSDIPGTVDHAALRVYPQTALSAGFSVRDVDDDSWTESAITFTNAPALGATVGTSGPVAAGTWKEFDVTSLVTGNGPASFALESSSSTALAYSSREVSAQAPQLVISSSQAGGDPNPPTSPDGVIATAASAHRVDLVWNAATDDVAVTSYEIRRNGFKVATLPASSLSYPDPGLAADSDYSYTVTALDAAGNASAESTPSVAHTFAVQTATSTVAADTYVDASKPTIPYGTQAKLRVDGDPIVRSYLRFAATVPGPTVERATLRVFATSALSGGFTVRDVPDDSWAENSTTFANAPATGTVVGSSGPVAANTWVSIDVTSLVGPDGVASFELESSSSTALAFTAKEGGSDAPVLVVEGS